MEIKANSKLSALVKGIAAAASGGAVALTLMACYGAPFIDNDGDGFDGNYDDCNDQDAATHPGAPDTRGDGVDQNCDGVDGINPEVDAGMGGNGGSGGSSTSSSSGGGSGLCVNCNEAVKSTGLVTPNAPICTPTGQQAFAALQTCACSTSCMTECGDNICKGTAATPACSTCVQSSCSTANLDCQEN